MTIKECCDAYTSKTDAISYAADKIKENPSLIGGETGIILLNVLRLIEQEKRQFASDIEAIAYKKNTEIYKENTAQSDNAEGTITERLGILGS